MDQLDYILNKLASYGFADSKQLSQPFRALLLSSLTQTQLAYVCTRVFTSEQSIFSFIQSTINQKDSLYNQTRKQLYDTLQQFIAKWKDRLGEYVQLIAVPFANQENMYKYFKREENARAKQATLGPIIKIIKHVTLKEQLLKIQPAQLATRLLDQLKFCKPLPTIKGKIWHLLGILMFKFPINLNNKIKQQIQNISMADLIALYKSDKNQTVVVKILKCFKYNLHRNNLDKETIDQLGTIILAVSMHPTPQFALSALSVLKHHSQLFGDCIFQNGKLLLQKLLNNLNIKSREVKQRAAQVLQKIMDVISNKIVLAKGKQLFSWAIKQLWQVLTQQTLKAQNEIGQYKFDSGRIIAVIRMIGSCAKVIKQVQGEGQLKILFHKMMQLSHKKTVKAYLKDQNQQMALISNRMSFKSILYKQKQITAFLAAFASIVSEITQVQQQDSHQLMQLCLLGVRQSAYFYQKYKQNLYNSLVLMMMGMFSHEQIYLLWMKKFIREGIKISVELPKKELTNQQYYNHHKRASDLWREIFYRPLWTAATKNQFEDVFVSIVYNLIDTLDDAETEALDQMGNSIKKNPQEFQYLLSIVTIVDPIIEWKHLSRLYPLCFKGKSSLPFLKLFSGLNLKADEMLIRFKGQQKQWWYEKIYESIVKVKESVNSMGHQVLKVCLTIPSGLLNRKNQPFLQEILRPALQLGTTLPSLAILAITLLQRIYQNIPKRSAHILKKIIPLLSPYLNTHNTIQQKLIYRTLALRETVQLKLNQNVTSFLGHIGGLAHYIVPTLRQKLADQRKTNIIAWDYDTDIPFQLPYQQKQLKINLVCLLPRTLYLMVSSTNQHLQLYAAQFIHSVITFMIGKIASRPKQLSEQGINQLIKLKENYGRIYQKVLPNMIKVGAMQTHPCYSLIKSLCIQLVHLLANTHQPDSADVISVLKVILDQNGRNKQQQKFSGFLFIEFIKWNLKQSPILVKQKYDWPVIKIAIRRLWASIQYNQNVIQLLKGLLDVIHKQQPILNKYLLDFFSMLFSLSLKHSYKEMEPLLATLSKLAVLQKQNLVMRYKSRKGRFPTLNQLLQHCYQKFFDKQRRVRKIAYEIWKRVDGSIQFLVQRGNGAKKLLFLPLQRISIENIQQALFIFNNLLQSRLIQYAFFLKLTESTQLLPSLKLLLLEPYQKKYLPLYLQAVKFQGLIQQILPYQHFMKILFEQQIQEQIMEQVGRIVKGKLQIDRFVKIVQGGMDYRKQRQLKGLKHYLKYSPHIFQSLSQPLIGTLLPFLNQVSFLKHFQTNSVQFQKFQREFIDELVRRWDVASELVFKRMDKRYWRFMIQVVYRVDGRSVIGIGEKIKVLQGEADMFKFFYILAEKHKNLKRPIPKRLIQELIPILQESFSNTNFATLLQPSNLLGQLLSFLPIVPFTSLLNKLNSLLPVSLQMSQNEKGQYKILYKCWGNIIKVAGKVQLFQYVRPIFRVEQSVGIVQEYLAEGYHRDEGQGLQFGFKLFQATQHQNPVNNLRESICSKLLLKMIMFGKINTILTFWKTYKKRLKESITQKHQDNLLQIVYKRCIYSIVQKLYERLPKKSQNEQIHGDVYKTFIKQAILDIKKIDTKYKDQQYVRSLGCAAYRALIQIFIKTQTTKQNFRNYLFVRKGDQKLWDGMVPNKVNYDFPIQTNFQEIDQQSNLNFNRVPTSQKLSHNYFTSSLFSTPVPNTPKSQPIIEQPKLIKKIQLDQINKIQIMLKVLKLIDHMLDTFNEQVPIWMNDLLNQFVKGSLSVKIFILKIVINRRQQFKRWGYIWVEPFIEYCVMQNNGGKYFHYYLRDCMMTLLVFLEYAKYELTPHLKQALNNLISTLIKILPHKVIEIYSQNIAILKRLMVLFADQCFLRVNLLEAMIRIKDKNKKDQKEISNDEWKMNGVLVMGLGMEVGIGFGTTVTEFNKATYQEKYKFLTELQQRRILHVVFDLLNHTQKKYHRTVGLFLGNLLHRLSNLPFRVTLQNTLQFLTTSFQSIFSSNNRTTKQKFPLVLLQISRSYPLILQQNKLFLQVQNLMFRSGKEQKSKLFEVIERWIKGCLQRGVGLKQRLQELVVHIRGGLTELLQQNDVIMRESLLSLLTLLTSPTLLQYCSNLPALHKAFLSYSFTAGNSYLNYLISLYNFYIEKQQEEILQIIRFRMLQAGGKCGRDKVVQVIERGEGNILELGYHKKLEIDWVNYVVPLILARSKKSSDYQRIIFQEPLDNLAAYYDWDFRNNFKINPLNLSQPFMTQGTQPQSSLYLQSGMAPIKEEQPLPEAHIRQTLQPSFPQLSIFKGQRKMMSNQIREFYNTNQISFSQVQMNSMNNVRFVKVKKDYKKNKKVGGGIGTVRKYKMGQLPYIQISKKDIIEPIVKLSQIDRQFSGELFSKLIHQLYLLQDREEGKILTRTLTNILQNSEQCNFLLISTLEKTLFQLYKLSGDHLKLDYKQIASKSNTYDVMILLLQEQLIGRQDNIRLWIDGLDMYTNLLQSDHIKGILLKILPEQHKIGLSSILEHKSKGKIQTAKQALHTLINQIQKIEQNNPLYSIREYLEQQRSQCEELLLQWDKICQNGLETLRIKGTLPPKKLSLLYLSLLQNPIDHPPLPPSPLQQSLLYLLQQNYDRSFFSISQYQRQFYQKWNKYGIYANWQRHQAISMLQKSKEVYEGLEMVKKKELGALECWEKREGSYVYDDHLSWVQILQIRGVFCKLLAKKFPQNKQIPHSMQNYLVQMAHGMVKKGLIGTAKPIMRKANIIKKQLKNPPFMWDFYKATLKLWLRQLQVNVWNLKRIKQSSPLQEYQKILKLTQREVKDVGEMVNIRFRMFKFSYYQSYLDSYFFCIDQGPVHFIQEYSSTLNRIYTEYIDLVNMESIRKDQENQEIQKIRKKLFVRFAIYCQRVLRLLESDKKNPVVENIRKNKDFPLASAQLIATNFINYMIKSFKIQDSSRTYSTLILKMIKIIQNYPNQLGNTFSQAVQNGDIPIHLFLPFIPQMLNVLAFQKIAPHFQMFFKKVHQISPQSLVFQFNTLFQFQSLCPTKASAEIFNILHKTLPSYFRFIFQLNQLTHPQHRLHHYLCSIRDLYEQMKSSKQNQRNHIRIKTEQEVKRIRNQFCYNPNPGKYNREFSNKWNQNLMNLEKMNLIALIDKLKNPKIGHGQGKISDFSPYFQEYNSPIIKLPSSTQQNLYITSFNPQILIMKSMRRPKRISFNASNQKQYYWLIKGCQDVRLDQRIEQIFQVINQIFLEHPQCVTRQLQLSTFRVIPMTKHLGMIEWVQNTKVLKQVLQYQYKRLRGTGNINESAAYNERIRYLQKHKPGKSLLQQHVQLLHADKKDISEGLKQQQNLLPKGMLRTALQKLAINLQAYFYLKNRFIRNYAIICLTGYILGIGDRHVQNFLINYSTAQVVSIDFGFSFGASFDNYLPQLVPFRMTRVFRQITYPIGISGVFKQTIIHALTAIKKKQHLLMDFCQVFIVDPVMDWIKVSKSNRVNQGKLSRQLPQSMSATNMTVDPTYFKPQDRRFYWRKVQIVRKKINGMNPKLIFIEQLQNSRHGRSGYFTVLRQALAESGNKNLQGYLSINEQVQSIMGMSIDGNLIGRMWIGWSPYL